MSFQQFDFGENEMKATLWVIQYPFHMNNPVTLQCISRIRPTCFKCIKKNGNDMY